MHDVSWGTKGSDKAEALPSVSSKKGKTEDAAVVQDTERVQEDLDAVFKETVKRPGPGNISQATVAQELGYSQKQEVW